ncbi:MAG: hypothetical protein ACMXYE_05380 [Candidatus Woesearchaeota archaeon]
MKIITKSIAVVLLFIAVLGILHEFDIYSPAFNTLFIGAILMIVLQIFGIIGHVTHSQKGGSMHYLTWGIFIIPAAWYLSHIFLGVPVIEHLTLILSILMLGEALYALQ